jgi:putative nucleotidyltransferase with HDIG domain
MDFGGQTLNLVNDFSRVDRLLRHVSQLINGSLEIKSLEGETLFCTLGSGGCKKSEDLLKCREEHWNLCKLIERTGQTVVKMCHDNVEIIGIPLASDLRTLGFLFAFNPSGGFQQKEEVVGLLEEIATLTTDQLYAQDEIESLTQELTLRYEELNLIYDIGRKLGEIDSSDKMIRFIVEKTMATLDAEMVVASIPSKRIIEVRYSSTDITQSDMKDPILMDQIEGIILKRVTFSETNPPHLFLQNVCQDSELGKFLDIPMSLLAVPVKLKENTAGFLGIIHYNQERDFQTGDVSLLSSLAEQISIIATNAELYQNLKDFLLNVIKTLVSSIEAKDSCTKGHSERVAAISMMIAEGLNYSVEDKEILHWAALLHDIGKIGVPEWILTKPAKLTEEEHKIIRDHPEKGYNILMPIQQFKGALDAIRFHHERLDGSGYPMGLKGLQIPLHARIIAVADIYDAMTSDRAYRNRRSDVDTQEEMTRVSGTQLDPDIVTLLFKLLEKKQRYKTDVAHLNQAAELRKR